MKPEAVISIENSGNENPRRNMAWQRLGVSEEDIAKIPKISHIISKLKGGRPQAIDFLRHSEAEEAKEFFTVYESIPQYLSELLPVEAFCFAARIDSRVICTLIFEQAQNQTQQAARMMTAANLEEIVEAGIGVAKTPEGVKDRENLLKATSFLPVPESMRISINASASASAAATAKAAAIATLPPAEDTIKRMSNRFTERFIGTESGTRPALAEGRENELNNLRPPNPREMEAIENREIMEEGEETEE